MRGPGSGSPPSGRRRLAGLSRSILRLTSLATPAAGAVSLLPWSGWFLETIRQFTCYSAALCVGMAVYSLTRSGWLAAVLNAAAAAVLLWSVIPYYRHHPETRPGTGDTPFTVLTCNLLFDQPGAESIIKALEAANPDVLILEEVTDPWLQALQPYLSRYPHQLGQTHERSYGIWLATRLPARNLEVVHTGVQKIPAVRAMLQRPGGDVCILGIHFCNPMRPAGITQWQQQFREFPALLNAEPTAAAIVAGDFNCTPFARSFQQFLLATELRDTRLGYGLQATWYAALMKWTRLGLPIDHILLRGPLRLEKWERGPVTASDHRFVMATLR